jgi:cystathionine gamma-lyase
VRDATRVVRAGLPPLEQGKPLLPGPTFAGTYHVAGDPAGLEYTYGRYANPTWSLLERGIGELEGGEAVIFASGMAAVSAVLAGCLRPGQVVVMPADGYYAARALASGFLERIGIQVRTAPTAGDAIYEQLPGAAMVWLETPSNPGLDVCDVRALVAAAHAEGARVVVDNTTATPLGQRPLELGADFSVASDTKALTGHGDLLLGHVAVREPAALEGLRAWRKEFGAVVGPMEAWLAHRSLATLEVRLGRQCANALAIASTLVERSDVSRVRYPGLPSDPAHGVASRQMHRFGPIVGFALESRQRAERFLGACGLVTEMTSFGSIHTTAERRARWGGDAVPEGFIRLSAGIEDPADLISDLTRALDVTPPP